MKSNKEPKLKHRSSPPKLDVKPPIAPNNTEEKKPVILNEASSPYFYENRPSLINFDSLLPEIPIVSKIQIPSGYESDAGGPEGTEDVEVKMKQPIPKTVSFEGFFHLALILLVASCIVLAVDNYLEKGVLVDTWLLRCMSGDVVLAIPVLVLIFACSMSVYLISLINQWFVYPQTRKESASKPQGLTTSIRHMLYNVSFMLYVVTQLGMSYSVISTIFNQRVSIMVSLLLTGSLFIHSMKMHSYYMYIWKTFSMDVDAKKKRPADVQVHEYLYFTVAPTMCFYRHYPKTAVIRPTFVLRQLTGILGACCMMYIIFMQYLDPIFKASSKSESIIATAYDVIKLSVPWFILWLLGSFALFHCYLNLLAELTCFGDRLWYRDFWNARSFDVFWRKWNIPTHHWLVKYVYVESMRVRYSRPLAVLFTFLLSAVLHEIAMSIIFRSFAQFYMFAAMLVQVPLVYLGKKLEHTHSSAGNMVMWLTLFAGQPLMLLFYFRNWYTKHAALCYGKNDVTEFIDQVIQKVNSSIH